MEGVGFAQEESDAYGTSQGKTTTPREEWHGRQKVRVQLLYFDGCPSYGVAVERLRQVLADCGLDDDPELVRVDTEHEARTLRFPGSPTIRIDGKDLFPIQGIGTAGLGCRVYRTPEGLSGAPTIEMITAALPPGMSSSTRRE